MKTFILLLILFLFSMAWAENYESTIYGKKIKKSTQIEAKSENDSSSESFESLSSLLSHKTPIFFQFSLTAPPQWSFRGSSSAHSLLLIDGNPIYDPSTIQGTWDLNLWPTSWAKSIIIETSAFEGALKWGGQGSGSLLKVNPIDKSNFGLHTDSSNSAGLTAGKHFEFGQLQVLSDSKNKRSPFIDSKEIYPLKNSQGLITLELPLINTTTPLKVFLLFGDSKTSLPEWNQDSKSFSSSEKHQSASLSWTPQTNKLNQSVSLQASHFERQYLNTSSTPLDETYLGNSNFLNYNAEYLLMTDNKIKFGFSHLEETLQVSSDTLNNQIKKRTFTPAYFGHEYYFNEDLAIQWGARAETNGLIPTVILNPSLELRGLNWSIVMFRSLKRPSLYQMYDSFLGNPNLKPENIQQITIETHDDSNQNTYQVLLFNRESINIVDYDLLTKKYYNIANSKTSGLEVHFGMPLKKLNWEFMGTIQNSLNQDKKRLAPEKILSSFWNYLVTSKLQTQVSGVWNSELADKNLPSYSVWNLSWQYIRSEISPKDIFSVAIYNLSQTKVLSNKQHLMEERRINLQFSSEF